MTLGSPIYYTNLALRNYLGSRSKENGFKLVHCDTDGIEWLGLEMQSIIDIQSDYIFTVCPEALSYLKSVSIAAELLSYGFSSPIHYPEYSQNIVFDDISFIGGSGYDLRKTPIRLRCFGHLLKPIFENGGRVEIYSEPFIKEQFQQFL